MKAGFVPQDPDFEARVRASFEKQALMGTLNATLSRVEPGVVEISAPYDRRFTQQDGFLHAGIVTALVDSACGYAAHSLMAPQDRVLSVEFKVNLLSPAKGEYFLARARVLKPGRTLTICRGEFYGRQGSELKLCAAMQATMIALGSR